MTPYVYVLILTVICGWSTNTTVAEFNDEDHCKAAAERHVAALSKFNVSVAWTCNAKD